MFRLRFLVIVSLLTLGLGVLAMPARADGADPLSLSLVSVTATADLGTAMFTYRLKSVSRSANVGIQLFVHHEGATGDDEWPLVQAKDASGATLVVPLYKGLVATGSFSAPLPVGHYGTYRLVLFRAVGPGAVDYATTLYDSAVNAPPDSDLNLHLTIISAVARVTKPVLVPFKPTVSIVGVSTYTVDIPAQVRIPATWSGSENGFWAMAKGSGGFSQVWADLKDAEPSGTEADPYREIPVSFHITGVKPGLWNVNFGLFEPSFGDPIQWLDPGADFEAGGDAWVVKASPDAIPPRVRYRDGHFVTLDGKRAPLYDDAAETKAVSFVRGGDYGNAITWNLLPQLDTPGYFVLLGELGCRFVRFNFNPDRYISEDLYEHAVDQVVQNIEAAGLYPLIAPQDLPQGATKDERIDKGEQVVEAMARKYRGQPVWLEVCNEPHEFDTWASWKTVATRYVHAIRAIDPDALVIVPFEGYSKDGRGAAQDPITSTTVDLYDGHAYVSPTEVATNFQPAVDAGLPVLIGEYGGDKPAYLHQIDLALQSMHGLAAVAPWAFTVAGQDSLPLVKDGSTAELVLTDTGDAIARDFRVWDAGKRAE